MVRASAGVVGTRRESAALPTLQEARMFPRAAVCGARPYAFSVSSTRSGVNGRWRSRLPVSR
jgi:hypothetical protein